MEEYHGKLIGLLNHSCALATILLDNSGAFDARDDEVFRDARHRQSRNAG